MSRLSIKMMPGELFTITVGELVASVRYAQRRGNEIQFIIDGPKEIRIDREKTEPRIEIIRSEE